VRGQFSKIRRREEELKNSTPQSLEWEKKLVRSFYEKKKLTGFRLWRGMASGGRARTQGHLD